MARIASTARDQIGKRVSDSELDQLIDTFRAQRRLQPKPNAESIVQGLALLAVLAEQELGLAAYEVQLMASVALVEGCFAEVDTGEGKTLAIALAAAFLAASGLPCHVITANDYLAERDAKTMGKLFARLGLRVGHVIGESDLEARRTAYARSITYTTAKECAADYLRDRLHPTGHRTSAHRLIGAFAADEISVQRGLHYALVDEADHALIDEAVTPLIISRTLPEGEMELAARAAAEAVQQCTESLHYRLNREHRSIDLLRPGLAIALDLNLPPTGLWGSRRRRMELLRLAIEAREFFRRGEQYVVDDGKIVIIDPATGRPMPMRTWRQGLHQLIEAKEGLPLTGNTETLARISFQAYFRLYPHLCGASGTLAEAADELWQTYAVPFIKVPRHLPSQLRRWGVRFYPDRADAHQALLQQIQISHTNGQPVLIGTRTVETSETLATLMAHSSLRCDRVLNAVRHREEASLVSTAGTRDQLTIATSMAGRGTDIRLGDGVAKLGGLHVLVIEANDSARIDRQLFGRAARQGDPGCVQSIYHAQDPVLERFIPRWLLRGWAVTLRPTFTRPLFSPIGQLFLAWAQLRASVIGARSRRNVIQSEKEAARSLAFAMKG